MRLFGELARRVVPVAVPVLLVAVLTGCQGGPPTTVVISDSAAPDRYVEAVDGINKIAGCELLDIEIGGTPEDWLYKWPPPGRVTLEVSSAAVHAEAVGTTRTAGSRDRARIWVWQAGVFADTLGHELGHALGIRHNDLSEGLMTAGPWVSWEVTEGERRYLESLCPSAGR